MNRTQNARGFTLVELMIVVVIAAILLAVAVPSFRSLVVRNNVESLQTAMARALNTARSEAASRNTRMVMCASNDGELCDLDTNATFSRGWIVYEERDGTPNRNPDVNVGEELVDVFRYDGDYPMQAKDAANNPLRKFEFTQQGYLLENPGVIYVCEPKNDLQYARGLAVQRSGLVIKTVDNVAPPGPDKISEVTITCP